jgi:hypothetical protein
MQGARDAIEQAAYVRYCEATAEAWKRGDIAPFDTSKRIFGQSLRPLS